VEDAFVTSGAFSKTISDAYSVTKEKMLWLSGVMIFFVTSICKQKKR